MTLFRGYADDTPLNVWLNEYIWPMEAKLTPAQVNIGAKIAAVEAIMTGTTTMTSMYWYPDQEAKAFRDIGVRLMSGPPIISGVSALDDYKHLITEWHGTHDDLIRATLNPHAPYTVTADDYKVIHQFKQDYNAKHSRSLMLHTHLAEDRSEMETIRDYAKRSGFIISPDITTPTQYLSSLGILNETTITAHTIETTPADLEILRQARVGIATNTVSNLKLGNNLPDIVSMLDLKMKVGLGTDGPASNNGLDMFEAMKMTALTQKSKVGNPAKCTASQIMNMATMGGAQVLGWDQIGSLVIGNYADLIAVDLKKPHLVPILKPESLIPFLVYSAHGSDVTDVMINGKWRMKDGALVNINIEQLTEIFYDQLHILQSEST
jgi:5-methylthioadenosine/S-adenosylhomocysteine deaminase